MTAKDGSNTSSPDAKRCLHCNALNPAKADWCTQCHKRFPDSPLQASPRPPPPPPYRRTREKKKWTPGRVIAWIVAAIAIVSGLLAVAFFVLMSIAMSSFGNNK